MSAALYVLQAAIWVVVLALVGKGVGSAVAALMESRGSSWR